jgi:IS30 family transposase
MGTNKNYCFTKVFKTITSDKGSEFATLSKIVLGVDVYYA